MGTCKHESREGLYIMVIIIMLNTCNPHIKTQEVLQPDIIEIKEDLRAIKKELGIDIYSDLNVELTDTVAVLRKLK